MPKIEYAPKALEDLQRIQKYIADNWGKNVAERVLKRITSDIKRLEQYPVSGMDLGKMIDAPTEYRYLFSEKNYVFYRLEPDNIRVIRILNELQDYMEQLFGTSPDPE
ncbi:MAG TPA: type II toxin-antitoxin system RelE/ParE family toxin [Bacillota bacterium]|nr:type II toxin-antitoxin system RelE/ParE family toxin [Bacillota bacterium]